MEACTRIWSPRIAKNDYHSQTANPEIARLTHYLAYRAEFLVKENDHLKVEVAILQNTAPEYQE